MTPPDPTASNDTIPNAPNDSIRSAPNDSLLGFHHILLAWSSSASGRSPSSAAGKGGTPSSEAGTGGIDREQRLAILCEALALSDESLATMIDVDSGALGSGALVSGALGSGALDYDALGSDALGPIGG